MVMFACGTLQTHITHLALWEVGLRLLFSINHDRFAAVLDDTQQLYGTGSWCLVYNIAASKQQVRHISPTGTLLATLLGWFHGVARYANGTSVCRMYSRSQATHVVCADIDWWWFLEGSALEIELTFIFIARINAARARLKVIRIHPCL
jgi:hypothetical protein